MTAKELQTSNDFYKHSGKRQIDIDVKERRRMTNKEIEKYHELLRKFVQIEKVEQRSGKLQELAKKVGAYSPGSWTEGRLDDPQLIFGIRNVPQTASMINTGETAAKNYRIAIIASIAALIAALAAWTAVIVNIILKT